MTTFKARYRAIETKHDYAVTDGPERTYDQIGHTYRVDRVLVVTIQTAYATDASTLHIRCYLSGPVTSPDVARERVDGQIVNASQMSTKNRAWLGPIVEDARRAHAAALRAMGVPA